MRAASLDPYIPLVSSIPAASDESQAVDWIERQNLKISAGTDFPLCIAMGETDDAVGMMGLFGIGEAVARCGYWVSPANRGKGISGDALEILRSWAFRAFNLVALEMLVEPWNSASIRTAGRAGFEAERTLVSDHVIDGKPCEMIRFVRVGPAVRQARLPEVQAV